MITYRATGIVLGNYWGGGTGGYPAESLKADSRENLNKQILAGIADGSLDGGMGFESIIGAIMTIGTIDSRQIDGKQFIAHDYEQEVYGDLSEDQQDFLIQAATYI